VDAGKVESVAAELHMGAGELAVDGGSEKLLDAEFAYNVPSWKPVIRYDPSSFRGRLVIEQKSGTASIGQTKNNWNLHFNEKIPLDLTLHLGAGESHLNLGRLNLRRVTVHIGAGQINLDLRGGEFRHNFPVEIHGGVGECVVHIPKGVGASAEVRGGIGGVQAHNFSKRDSRYYNDAYSSSQVKIEMQIHGGIGSVQLFAD
jgi:hypothetical protein